MSLTTSYSFERNNRKKNIMLKMMGIHKNIEWHYFFLPFSPWVYTIFFCCCFHSPSRFNWCIWWVAWKYGRYSFSWLHLWNKLAELNAKQENHFGRNKLHMNNFSWILKAHNVKIESSLINRVRVRMH